ncbi:hypothetical protein ACTJI2_12365 [Pseudoxanthomonas sp. 22568]|uniref:hypothetical protein n=1 Tax=Pseudoxanthomonas sp. 22568 TaxID=3453945 RepID=UPI003F830E7C
MEKNHSNKVTATLGLMILCAAVSACKQEQSQGQATTTEPPAAAPKAPSMVPGTVIVEVKASEERMRVSAVAEKLGDRVVAKGASGVLVFGPYVPLSRGHYSLLIEGTSKTPFVVDVAHTGGTQKVGVKRYEAQSGNAIGAGSLATLDFDIAEAVQNAEFRVIVPEGADTTVTSYKVVVR